MEQTTNAAEYRGNFFVSKGENIRFNLYMTRKSIITSIILLFFVVFAIRIYQQMTQESLAFFPALIGALPMALLSAALIPTLQLSTTALSILMVYRQGKAKPFAQEVLLNKEGLFATSAHGSSKVVWKNMALVRETPFDFLMFYSDKHAFIIPKKQMKDRAAEEAAVRRILRNHLSADRLKLRG